MRKCTHDSLPKYPYTMTMLPAPPQTVRIHHLPKNSIHTRSSPKQGTPKTHMSRPMWVAPGPCASRCHRCRSRFRNEKRPRQSRLALVRSTPLLTCRLCYIRVVERVCKDWNNRCICVSARFIGCVNQERIVCWTATTWYAFGQRAGNSERDEKILHSRPHR
jgi:hypothetical protein